MSRKSGNQFSNKDLRHSKNLPEKAGKSARDGGMHTGRKRSDLPVTLRACESFDSGGF
jgi:hypothetical protein